MQTRFTLSFQDRGDNSFELFLYRPAGALKESARRGFFFIFWTAFLILHSFVGCNREFMPFHSPLSGVPVARLPPFASRTALPPLQSGVCPKKIPPWIFLGIGDLFSNLRAAKPRIRALVIGWQVRDKKIPPWAFNWLASKRPKKTPYLQRNALCAIIYA